MASDERTEPEAESKAEAVDSKRSQVKVNEQAMCQGFKAGSRQHVDWTNNCSIGQAREGEDGTREDGEMTSRDGHGLHGRERL